MRRLSRSFYFCPCLPLNSLVTSNRYKIVRLANGVHSVHSLAHGETFHPVIGPVAEAEVLYVKQLRLLERLREHSGEFVIWDVGLGAAANPLTVLRASRGIACSIRIVSFDQTLEPLKFALAHVASLPYLAGYEPYLRTLLDAQQVCFQEEKQQVAWELQVGDFPAFVKESRATIVLKPLAILFDGFPP